MNIETTVGLPIYNEEANLAHLLSFLTRETAVVKIITVDDLSSDSSFSIARAAAAADPKIDAHRNAERSGQLEGWLKAAQLAKTETIVFIDADSLPESGAVEKLAKVVEGNPSIVIASGRVVPDSISSAWPAARFRAAALDRVRSMQFPKETVIGRFFAVRRTWFLESANRSDIIANDAYLGGIAIREGRKSIYVRDAVCRYCEAQTTFDFAAQRQRADAGYAQLHELGILRKTDCPPVGRYLGCLASTALRDPIGAIAWAIEQLKARKITAYRQSGRDSGAWEIQPSTKRKLP